MDGDDSEEDEWAGATQAPLWDDDDDGSEEEGGDGAAKQLQTIDSVVMHIRYLASSQNVADEYELALGRHLVGRLKGSDIRVLDTSTSSRHCEVTVGLNSVSVTHIAEHGTTVIRVPGHKGTRLSRGVSFTLHGVAVPGKADVFRTQSFDVVSAASCARRAAPRALLTAPCGRATARVT